MEKELRIYKTSNEKFAIGLKYISPDLSEGASLDSCTVVISPSEASGLKTSGSPSIDADTVEQVIYGGENNHEYKVKFTVTTSEDFIFEDCIFVIIRDI